MIDEIDRFDIPIILKQLVLNEKNNIFNTSVHLIKRCIIKLIN